MCVSTGACYRAWIGTTHASVSLNAHTAHIRLVSTVPIDATEGLRLLLLNCVHTNASKHSLAVDDDDDDGLNSAVPIELSAVWETAAVQWHVSVLEHGPVQFQNGPT